MGRRVPVFSYLVSEEVDEHLLGIAICMLETCQGPRLFLVAHLGGSIFIPVHLY